MESGQESRGVRGRREDARRSRRTSERTREGSEKRGQGRRSATKSRPAANAPLLPLALLLRATREDEGERERTECSIVLSDRFSRTASAAAGFFIDNYNARASRFSISRKPILRGRFRGSHGRTKFQHPGKMKTEEGRDGSKKIKIFDNGVYMEFAISAART